MLWNASHRHCQPERLPIATIRRDWLIPMNIWVWCSIAVERVSAHWNTC